MTWDLKHPMTLGSSLMMCLSCTSQVFLTKIYNDFFSRAECSVSFVFAPPFSCPKPLAASSSSHTPTPRWPLPIGGGSATGHKRPVVCLFRFLMKPRYRNTSVCVYQGLHDPTRTIEALQLFLLHIPWQNESRKHCIHTLLLFVCMSVNFFLKFTLQKSRMSRFL